MQIGINHGQATNTGDIHVYYESQREHYQQMNIDELTEQRSRLKRMRWYTYRRFITHRTVPWFLGSGGLMFVGMIASWMTPSHVPVVISLIGAVAAIPAIFWMKYERRAIFDALGVLRKDITLVETFLEIRKAEEIVGR